MSVVTSCDVLQWLGKRYAPPEWRIFPEVRNGTGWARESGRADAVAMNMWPSGGYAIHGIEIKVSRNDWLQESRNPAKNEGVRQFCDEWWIAVPDASIVKPCELPIEWGLLEVTAERSRVVVKAPTRINPTPLDRGFAAVLIRSAADATEVSEHQAQKAALLKAPLRAVTERSQGVWTLTCGHKVMRGHPYRLPKAVRCLQCAEGTS